MILDDLRNATDLGTLESVAARYQPQDEDIPFLLADLSDLADKARKFLSGSFTESVFFQKRAEIQQFTQAHAQIVDKFTSELGRDYQSEFSKFNSLLDSVFSQDIVPQQSILDSVTEALKAFSDSITQSMDSAINAVTATLSFADRMLLFYERNKTVVKYVFWGTVIIVPASIGLLYWKLLR